MNSNNRVPISIVMPVYNRVTFLEESIDSVLSQQHPSYELLIVDDGSNIPAIENIFLEIEGHHKIRIIRKAHGGPGSAMNVGVSEAKNRYVCRLDSDDKITPDALPILQGVYSRQPERQLLLLLSICHRFEIEYCPIRPRTRRRNTPQCMF